MDFSKVRGFNYQPPYGSTLYENWLYFNAEIIEADLRKGKAFFPGMNVIRIWLSWDAYIRDPQQFCGNFEKVLSIADELKLKVMPVLFNRWHGLELDCGGVYIDQICPVSWILDEVDRGYNEYNAAKFQSRFDAYMADIVGCHANDPRIMAWDLCNEPFYDYSVKEETRVIEQAELAWLKRLYELCKQHKAKQKIGVSITPDDKKRGLEVVADISDVLLIHPYFTGRPEDEASRKTYLELLDCYEEVSEESGKQLLVTETCWGAFDDEKRAENARYTLSELARRNIGFIVHALCYSKMADLHDPEDGPTGPPENLAFINKKGELRKGHEVFNEFCG